MKVSIKQISEITGFSPATVSNALNYKRGVNAETSARIFKAARDLGYYDDSRISKVKFVMFKKTGVIVENNPFFPLLIAGVEQEARASGMEMIMCNLDKRDSSYVEQVKWLQNDKASVIVLLGTEMQDEDIDVVRGISNPFVTVDYWKEDMSFNSIVINNEDSTRMATEYLIAKGHREIGYLKGNFRITPFRGREEGYRSALHRAGIPLNEEYQVTLSITIDGAYEDMKRYLRTNPKLPTAFFADDDMIAHGAMKAITECGLRIPEDVSIIGFDDVAFSAVSSPALTTVRVPKQELGRVAVRRLMQMMQDGGGSNLKIAVGTQFIERDSVREIG